MLYRVHLALAGLELATVVVIDTDCIGSYTNKTDCHDINEIMLKVALNSITVTPNPTILFLRFSCLVLSFDTDPIFSKFLYDFIDFQPAMVKAVIRNLPVNQMMRSVLVKRNQER
jgi:hypothetical protein